MIMSPSVLVYSFSKIHLNATCLFHTGMDDDIPNEAFAEFKTRHLGVWGVAQIAAGTGLAVYAMWVGILQPGFRKVPLRLQVWFVVLKTLNLC